MSAMMATDPDKGYCCNAHRRWYRKNELFICTVRCTVRGTVISMPSLSLPTVPVSWGSVAAASCLLAPHPVIRDEDARDKTSSWADKSWQTAHRLPAQRKGGVGGRGGDSVEEWKDSAAFRTRNSRLREIRKVPSWNVTVLCRFQWQVGGRIYATGMGESIFRRIRAWYRTILRFERFM